MGSQVSLWPPSPAASKSTNSRVRLTAANGTLIRAYGQESRKIQIGDKAYMFIFLIAQISRPILGIDFLQFFGMSVDLRNRQLLHSGMATRFSSAASQISGVNVVLSPCSPFARLLDEFLEITDTALASCTTKHGVECYINTTGPPVRTAQRRLLSDKLAVAKKVL